MTRWHLGDRQEDDLRLRNPPLGSSLKHGNISYLDHLPQNFITNKARWRKVSQGQGRKEIPSDRF